jgi:hypothetical protein
MPGRPLPLVTALYAVAAFAATLPAVLDFRSGFLSTGLSGHGEAATGDHLQTSYRFWLVGHQLEQGRAPWRDPYSYQPLVEPELVLGGWPYGLAFWPLDALFGPVVAWNLLLLATIVAAGVLTYLWLTTLRLPPAAAAVGGLAFAVAPYRLTQSGGHLLGWAAVFLPLALWAYERSRRAGTRGRGHAWGALAAGAIVSVPLSGQLHLALGAIPLLLAYAAARFRPVAAAWTGAGAAAGVALGLAARELVIERSQASEGRALEEVAAYSADWLDLVSRWRLDGLEQFVYVGWLTPALALAGLVLLARGRRGRRGLALVLGLGAALPLLLALGTNLPLYEELRGALPPLRYPRVPGRFVPIADLALAALAAVAVGWLLARVRPRLVAAAAALALALVAADLLVFPLRSSVADPANEAYAALPAEGRILELPIWERGTGQFGSVYLYYTLQAPRERPTGYSLAPRETFRFTARYNRLDCGAWLRGDRAALEALGIRALLFHRGLYERGRVPGAWFAWRGLEGAGYRPGERGGAIWLWEPGQAPASPPPVPEPDRSEALLCDGWSGHDLEGFEGALWLWARGRAGLLLEASRPVLVEVFVDGEPAVRQRLAGRGKIEVPVGPPSWHALVLRVAPPPGAGEPILRLTRVDLG